MDHLIVLQGFFIQISLNIIGPSGDDWWMSEEIIIVITAGCILMGLIIAPVWVWCWRRTRRGRNDNNVAMEEILDPDVENNDNNDQ